MFGRKQQGGGTAEYLCDFVTQVLDAFHTGEGFADKEFVDIAMAQKIIWQEIHRVLAQAPQAPFLWLRVEGPDAVTIWRALMSWPTATGRCIGPRREGDPTVIYATIVPPMPTPDVIVEQLTAKGLKVNRWFLGPRPEFK